MKSLPGEPRIVELDPDTVGRIAAGEVVERPASAVKELWENAADAGSKTIVVELEHGGQRLIRVSDDGCGMSPEEAHLAFRRHATSKIRGLSDLDRLTTFGFRGEALPSIAAVARVELATRRPGDDAGFRLTLEAGRTVDAGPTGCPVGTLVAVRDLFFNTPARLKSLRSQGAELAVVSFILQAAALARPDIALRAAHQGRWLVASPGTGRLAGAAAAVFGRLAAEGLLPVGDESSFPAPGAVASGICVSGLVGRPEVARPSRSGQYFLVNRRPVKSPVLQEALESAFRTLVPRGRFPIAAIHLAAPAGAIDVNVHPAKVEVRFADEDGAFEAVAAAVAAALERGPLVVAPRYGWQGRQGRLEGGGAASGASRGASRGAGRAGDGSAAEAPAAYRTVVRDVAPRPVPGARPPAARPRGERPAPARLRTGPDIASLAPLGQVLGTYILAAGADGLYIIDQHAAHERITFERALASASPASQPSLVPETVELDAAALAVLEGKRGLLQAMGFNWEAFGGNTVLLRAVPVICGGRQGAAHFLAAVDRAREAHGGRGPDDRVEAALILASCHASVRAHDPLDAAEMRALLLELSLTARPHACPHGRPTVAYLNQRDLERLFGRG
jgi:DNA mismatch repair protein MutL